ncbi:MAG: tRNA (guanosine(46)-N7)-methyltransferase TrmB [Bacteroidetes bacterium]|nr:tRNA (guanosine(46)-N7)-methyltransferase TrmB [Bacteroidota bacterium]
MGQKKKLLHFEENKTFPHFFQPSYEELIKGFGLKGNWKKDFFENGHSLVIELGCGKGEYTVGLAEKYPHKNFLGIDRKGARMWRGAKTSSESGFTNVGFIRTRIEQLNLVFDENEVSEIWITFPDPQPKRKNKRKRLTSQRFLDIYQKILVPGGKIHLKTDSSIMFEYTLDLIKKKGYHLIYQTDNLYQSDWLGEAKAFQTHYENGYLEKGIKINYLIFTLEHHEGN